jgi:hypothetical protein
MIVGRREGDAVDAVEETPVEVSLGFTCEAGGLRLGLISLPLASLPAESVDAMVGAVREELRRHGLDVGVLIPFASGPVWHREDGSASP